jgi:hypothetical protein
MVIKHLPVSGHSEWETCQTVIFLYARFDLILLLIRLRNLGRTCSEWKSCVQLYPSGGGGGGIGECLQPARSEYVYVSGWGVAVVLVTGSFPCRGREISVHHHRKVLWLYCLCLELYGVLRPIDSE